MIIYSIANVWSALNVVFVDASTAECFTYFYRVFGLLRQGRERHECEALIGSPTNYHLIIQSVNREILTKSNHFTFL